MQLLYNFGFEPVLFLAQIVNFLIIFVLLKKFLYPSIVRTLEDRKTKIAKGLADAQAAAKLMEDVTAKEEEILKKAQLHAASLIDDAKKQQAELMRQSEADTQKRVEKMLSDAKEQIKFESLQAEKRLEGHISRIAIDFLKQSVETMFGPDEQELILKNALKKMKKKAD